MVAHPIEQDQLLLGEATLALGMNIGVCHAFSDLALPQDPLAYSLSKTSGEVRRTSGEVRGLSRSSGDPDSLPATRQICLQFKTSESTKKVSLAVTPRSPEKMLKRV